MTILMLFPKSLLRNIDWCKIRPLLALDLNSFDVLFGLKLKTIPADFYDASLLQIKAVLRRILSTQLEECYGHRFMIIWSLFIEVSYAKHLSFIEDKSLFDPQLKPSLIVDWS